MSAPVLVPDRMVGRRPAISARHWRASYPCFSRCSWGNPDDIANPVLDALAPDQGPALGALGIVVHPVGLSITEPGGQLKRWTSERDVQLDSRAYDFVVDRPRQVWWPGDTPTGDSQGAPAIAVSGGRPRRAILRASRGHDISRLLAVVLPGAGRREGEEHSLTRGHHRVPAASNLRAVGRWPSGELTEIYRSTQTSWRGRTASSTRRSRVGAVPAVCIRKSPLDLWPARWRPPSSIAPGMYQRVAT